MKNAALPLNRGLVNLKIFSKIKSNNEAQANIFLCVEGHIPAYKSRDTQPHQITSSETERFV